jgi:hypothetical protein
MLGEECFGSTICQCSRRYVVMETVVTRKGVIAARIAEDFCIRYIGNRGFYLGLCVFADVCSLVAGGKRRDPARGPRGL